MKKLILLLTVLVVFVQFDADAAKRRSRGKRNVHNVAQTIDSLYWLMERKCDLYVERMGYDDGTLDRIKQKFATLSPNVADSLLAAKYNQIVKLFEQERNNRAHALTDCYYALAKPDDPNLGTLYLNDMVLAIERNDSVGLRTHINNLKSYAVRNNLDYDQDLYEAEENMTALRKRIAFNEMRMSGDLFVWVLDASLIKDKWVYWAPFQLCCGTYFHLLQSTTRKQLKGSSLIELKDGIDGLYVYKNELDNDNKTLFLAWGTDQGGSSNPELLSVGRQTVQNMHATVSGELARKKYSAGKRIAGELGATIADVAVNALFDYLSVTTQHSYRYELSLTQIKPGLMEGVFAMCHVETKSNRPNDPKVESTSFPVRYYKSYPEEKMYMINHKNEPVLQAKMDARQFKARTEYHKLQSKKWKEEQKAWKKANKGKKPQFDSYQLEYNNIVLDNLRQRAEQSLDDIKID